MQGIRSYSLYIALFLAFATAFFFQNCGKGFQSAGPNLDLASSAQCMVKLRDEPALMKLNIEKLRCDDVDSYVCERRVFRPGVGNSQHHDQECSLDKTVCVDVMTYMFDTEVARQNGGDSAEFSPGGDYNREELKCNYRFAYRGLSPFEGQGSTLEESLEAAISACRRAKGGT